MPARRQHDSAHYFFSRLTLTFRHHLADGRFAGAHHADQVQVGAVQSRTQQPGRVDLESLLGTGEEIGILVGILDALIESLAGILPLKAARRQNGRALVLCWS